MPYWEYEFRMDEINKTIEKENKENEEQQKQYSGNNYMKSANDIMRASKQNFGNSSFKMPSVPKIPSMPKI